MGISEGKISQIMGNIFDIIVIGILWLLCSIPIITLFVSTTAAYYTMAKVVRAGEGYLFSEFFKSFKLNLKQGILAGTHYIIAGIILALDMIYLWNNRSQANDTLFIILCGVAFILISVNLYFCPMLSRFTKTTKELLFTSSFSAFRYLPVTIGCIIVIAVFIFLIWLMPWMIFLAPGLFMYLFTYPSEFVMKHFMAKNSEEEQKWYDKL
ncbi:MAG: YesL family protein [Lachnospiraceae bacterium]|nr:YesL family protein [Lachnospiraceae bacterium]